MLKYLLIAGLITMLSPQTKAQTPDDSDREEFIATMTNFASTQHYVDQIPQYEGGFGALFDYLHKNMVYPEAAKKEHLSAQVFVSFIIDKKTGLPRESKIVQSSNTKFNSETLRLIKAMPAWQPAKVHDQDVNMVLTIPVYFHWD
jgi:TonB family protein